MPKKYKIKDTVIGVKARDMKHIIKILRPGETLAQFGRDAIVNTYSQRERERVAEMTSTNQFYKIMNLNKDVGQLKRKIDDLEYDVNEATSEMTGWKKLSKEMQKTLDLVVDKLEKEGKI